MKVNNVQQYSASYTPQKCENKKGQASPSFGGAMAVDFWDAIARGGFAASFTVQDMTGTNFPRTYQALQRNKDITGQNNWGAAAEVAIREFVTGPSMCIIPMVVLGAAKKIGGSANEVPIEHIEAFSPHMKNVMKNVPIGENTTVASYAENVKSDFYKKMFSLALDEGKDYTHEERTKISQSAEKLASMLEQYEKAPKRSVIAQFLNKNLLDKATNQTIEAKDQIFSKIVDEFTSAKKGLTTDYSTLLSSNMKGEIKPKSISSLIKDISNFGTDVVNSIQKESAKGGLASLGIKYNSFMDDFKQKRAGSKFMTNFLMVALTGLFITQIPKLYSLHKTNPETDAFREQKNNKGVENANK